MIADEEQEKKLGKKTTGTNDVMGMCTQNVCGLAASRYANKVSLIWEPQHDRANRHDSTYTHVESLSNTRIPSLLRACVYISASSFSRNAFLYYYLQLFQCQLLTHNMHTLPSEKDLSTHRNH